MKTMMTPRYMDLVSRGACYRTSQPLTRSVFSYLHRETVRKMTRRHLYFGLAMIVSLGVYWIPLKSLMSFSFHSSAFNYTGIVPVLSACLIYLERKRIFRKVQNGLGSGTTLVLIALGLAFWGTRHAGWLSAEGYLSLITLSLVAVWLGLFVMCYGTKAFRAAAFQMLFLLLMVPLPQSVTERVIFLLRTGSTQMAGFFFRLAGIPAFREGFKFSLPGIDIEVAEQCSGIRSGIAMLITSLLMGHLFLRSSWKKLCLVLAAIPVTIFKNGLRIVTISMLSVHPSLDSLTVLVHHVRRNSLFVPGYYGPEFSRNDSKSI